MHCICVMFLTLIEIKLPPFNGQRGYLFMVTPQGICRYM